ncbi:hypothetical protein J2S58_001246 [Nakamurella flavida]|nr:DUF1844 domain-containing protein [Nakamurella flavida]MDP9777623.1 hypothetical protein [Nakamurella flavida]
MSTQHPDVHDTPAPSLPETDPAGNPVPASAAGGPVAYDPTGPDGTDAPLVEGEDIGPEASGSAAVDLDGAPAASTEGPDDRDLVDIPAIEVISRAAVLLMSAAAEQLGLADADPDAPAHRDLDEARRLITALAGLISAAAPDLGPHAAAFRDGLSGLQGAFREYSTHPDAPGEGPGENLRVSRRG